MIKSADNHETIKTLIVKIHTLLYEKNVNKKTKIHTVCFKNKLKRGKIYHFKHAETKYKGGINIKITLNKEAVECLEKAILALLL